MRVVVQRVSQSNVKVSGEVIGEIKEGLMVLVSFVDEDNDTDLGQDQRHYLHQQNLQEP